MFGTAADLAGAAAKHLRAVARQHARTTRPVTVALSGGRIAQEFFTHSAAAFAGDEALLARWHFFWADERCVPPDDVESNYRMAHEHFLKPLGVPESNVHRVQGELDPGAAAAAAADAFRRVTEGQGGEARLDLALLGMGEDGHVASLFPGEPERLANSPELFRDVVAVKPPPRRVTMAYGLLTEADQVWVLVSGGGKEGALRASLTAAAPTPLGRVLRARRDTRIYTDFQIQLPS